MSTNTGTGAATLTQITHAFSLSNPLLAFLILAGAKTIENRPVRLKPGWYALHVSRRTPKSHIGVAEDREHRTRFAGSYPGFQELMTWCGCVVGAVYVSHSLPHEACKDDPYAVASYPIKNIITKVVRLDAKIADRGNVGAWPLSDEARGPFLAAVDAHLLLNNPIVETDGATKHPKDLAFQSSASAMYEESHVEAPTKAVAKGKTVARRKPGNAAAKAAAAPKQQAKLPAVLQKTIAKPTDIRGFFQKAGA